MSLHKLKIDPQYFESVVLGEKQFEIRKNDQDFRVGDEVVLLEWKNNQYTGRWANIKIIYLTNYGQPDGQVVFGFELHEYNSFN